MFFPIDRLLRGVVWPSDSRRYSAQGLYNNGSIFIYFFQLWGTIHCRGFSPVTQAHRQWLPDIRAPCKRCCHPSVSVRNTNPHKQSQQTYGGVNTETHKSNLDLNQILSLCFSEEGGKMLLEIVYTGNHFFSTVFQGCLPPSLPFLTLSKGEREISITLKLPAWLQQIVDSQIHVDPLSDCTPQKA